MEGWMSMRRTWLIVIAAWVSGTSLAAPTLKEFRQSYPLKPVRGYTFLGTENSVHQLWGSITRYDKPIVEPEGGITGWFNPADHVAWLGEAMKTLAYDFGLVDGYLPAVRYVYRKVGTAETCEMTAFAVDSAVAGEVFLYVRLIEKGGGNESKSWYSMLPASVPVDQGAFEKVCRVCAIIGRDFSHKPEQQGEHPWVSHAGREKPGLGYYFFIAKSSGFRPW
jgi:hypothetical protein